MIPLFHPDYRTPDYAAQLRDLPHDIAGLSAQNAKPIGATLLGKMKHMSEAERAEFADSFKAAVAKYRKIKAEKGYPWER